MIQSAAVSSLHRCFSCYLQPAHPFWFVGPESNLGLFLNTGSCSFSLKLTLYPNPNIVLIMATQAKPPPAVQLTSAFGNCRPADCSANSFCCFQHPTDPPLLLQADMCTQNLTLSVGLSDRSLFLYVCSLLIGVNIFRFSTASYWLVWKKTEYVN